MLCLLLTNTNESSKICNAKIDENLEEGPVILKRSKYEIDMCNGSIMDKLISFSLPLMLSSILQLMFNAVDIILVGRFSSRQALAAVGSTPALAVYLPIFLLGISVAPTFSALH